MNYLTHIFSESPAKTIGPTIDWPHFWKLLQEARYHKDRFYDRLQTAEWMINHLAFGDDGARMVLR